MYYDGKYLKNMTQKGIVQNRAEVSVIDRSSVNVEPLPFSFLNLKGHHSTNPYKTSFSSSMINTVAYLDNWAPEANSRLQ